MQKIQFRETTQHPRLCPCSFCSSYQSFVLCDKWTHEPSCPEGVCLCHLWDAPLTRRNNAARPLSPQETRWRHAGPQRELRGHAHSRAVQSRGDAAGRHPGLEPGHFLFRLWGGPRRGERRRKRLWLWVLNEKGKGTGQIYSCVISTRGSTVFFSKAYTWLIQMYIEESNAWVILPLGHFVTRDDSAVATSSIMKLHICLALHIMQAYCQWTNEDRWQKLYKVCWDL